ncbi:MAG TPA: DUF5050 domain-containing protein [Pyrinomonadaceae bacterium]|nr:DUF5050 domain-containing protein [Pyrinomonadaceae bacterium]
MKRNLLAWNFSYPTPELFGGQLSTRSLSDLPFSPSTLSESGVSAGPVFDFFAMPAPDAGSSKVVFSSNRDGNAEIYSMSPDGSSLARLTSNDFNDEHPRWSPDGTKILFQSDRDNPETGNADVYAMSTDGSGQTRLTTDDTDDSAAVWSPDGSKIMFQSLRNGQYYQIYVMNADGTNQLNVSNGIAADYQPSWSPDGSKIAFASERDQAGRPNIYVMNANGSNQTRLTFTGEPFRDEQPAWSRDATTIAFVSTRDSVIETWQETDDEGGILNRSRVLTNKEVYKMNADGSNQIRLTNTLENDDSPYWSPDGTQIIFRSDRERECCDPADQVWLMNGDGINQINLSNNIFGDHGPSWSVNVSNAPGEIFPDAAQPVTINFDNLAAGTRVTNQYAQVKFSAFGHYGVVEEVLAWNTSGLGGSPFNALGGRFFPASGCYASPEIWLDFQAPVNNLSFLMLNMYALYYGAPYYTYVPYTAGIVDVYVNRLYYSTYNIDIPGQYRNPSTPLPINLSGIQGVTGIRITSTSRSSGPVNAGSSCQTIFYDDFNFTPDFDVRITNARVSGVLNETTQKALAGADIALNASVVPSNQTGGTYSWTVTDPYVVVGGAANSSSVTIRSTNTGTGTAKVTYTKNGFTASGTVTINAVLPTLTSFTASENADRVTPEGTCEGGFTITTSYILGCPKFTRTDPAHVPGIRFTVNAQLPAGTFLNDTSQSGLKYVQLVSAFRKSLVYGSIVCTTARTQENQPDTGWQLDTTDPYNTGGDLLSDPPKRFSGQSVTMIAEDSPKSALQLYPDTYDAYSELDAHFVDDPFEMYVVYFVGASASNPTFQRVLGFQTSSVAYIPWRWGGQIVFDRSAPLNFRLQSTTQPGAIQAQSKSQMRPYSGNVDDIVRLERQCPGGPPRATNMIDVSEFFVQQHYKDFLNREPEQAGWNWWRHEITQCGFDTNCIRERRYSVSRAFFEAPEFIGNKPALQLSNKGTDSYNREFVRECYYGYLKRSRNRDPEIWDSEGFHFWLGSLTRDYQARGDVAYFALIEAFIVSTEYRDRFPGVPNF